MTFSINSLANPGFSWPSVLSMALASKLSYEEKEVVESTALDDWGYLYALFLDIKNTECFLAETDSHVLLSFRGTQGIGDWVGNINLFPIHNPNYGTVHNGFFDAFYDVEKLLIEHLPKDKPMWITGHSLGGALAAIASVEWRSKFEIYGICTFGQPRTGHQDFSETIRNSYPDSFFRFVNNRDLITRIPPGFQHAGSLYHFDANGDIQEISAGFLPISPDPEPLTLDEFHQFQENINNIRNKIEMKPTENFAGHFDLLDDILSRQYKSLSDHKIDRYIKNISGQILASPDYT
ncbi:lipase family protein [Microbulbifer sp. DLAB2-AA]|uniref:lipase family protein n=1 Tax=Microbulbifer sp. DLAB2-AA TaxID=3243394 RepID=UPI00403926EC